MVAGSGEAAGHLEDGGEVDPGLVGFGEALVVAGAAAPAGDPGVGALDDPAPGQDLEAFLVFGLEDDLDGDAELAGGPAGPGAVVGLVGPHAGEAVPGGGAGGLQEQRRPGPVGGAGGGDHDADEQAPSCPRAGGACGR
jgi:hypothetical protein